MWNDGKLDSWVTPPPRQRPRRERQVRRHHHGLLPGLRRRATTPATSTSTGRWPTTSRICDNYFCSVIGGTDINRLYSMTGTADPDCWDGGGQFLDTKTGTHPVARAPTSAPRTSGGRTPSCSRRRASPGRCTAPPTPTSATTCSATSRSTARSAAIPTLAANAFGSNALPRRLRRRRAGRAACPRCRGCSAAWSTPSTRPRPSSGDRTTPHKVVLALLNSPQWPNTALFITYDENGGFFDHVPPPVPSHRQRSGPASSSTSASSAPTAQDGGRGASSTSRSGSASVCPRWWSRRSRATPTPAAARWSAATPSTTPRCCASSRRSSTCAVPRRDAATQHPGPQPLARVDDRRHDQRVQLRGRARHLSADAADDQPRRPPRAQRMPGPDRHAGQRELLARLPGSGHRAACPAQEPLPSPVKRPSGLDPNCTPRRWSPRAGSFGALGSPGARRRRRPLWRLSCAAAARRHAG